MRAFRTMASVARKARPTATAAHAVRPPHPSMLKAFAREVAGSRMTRSALGERWLDLGADPVLGPLLARQRTSRAEVAAGGRVEGARHIPGQLDAAAPMFGVGYRDRR